MDEVLEYAGSIREGETTGARLGLERLRALCARADAAELLAKADVAVCDAADAVSSLDRSDRIQVKVEWNAAKAERGEALAAYVHRARMAQGVGDA